MSENNEPGQRASADHRLSSKFRLNGKTAIVTGVGPTNGRYFALALAEAGANVSLVARSDRVIHDLADELRALGVGALPIQADMSHADEVVHVVTSTQSEFGGLDILCNHVGTSEQRVGDIVDLSLDDWREPFVSNLETTFLATRAAARTMIAQGRGGSIINTGSTGSRTTPPKLAHFSAAKAGLEQFTRCAAAELAQHGIRVNCIRLGTFENAGPHLDAIAPGFQDWWLQETPMHRWGRADEAAGAALYLASDASSYVTGAVLAVTGGIAVS